MRYNNEVDESKLLASEDVRVCITKTVQDWHSHCRVVKRDDEFFIDLKPSSPNEFVIPLPQNAVVDQSDDGLILVMIDQTQASLFDAIDIDD